MTIPDLLTANGLQIARRLLLDAPSSDGKTGAGDQAGKVKNKKQLQHACEADT